MDEAGGRALAEQSNGKISFVRCDVTLPADIEALMDAAAAKAGGIDIVFNNAAAGGDRAPIDEITPEGWDRTMDLVLKSVAMGIRRSEEHTSELQSLMRISYAVFCLKKKKHNHYSTTK